MRLKEVAVTRLFGVFDHILHLNLNERITIILGPNGIGKTIMLRMIDGLLTARFNILRSIPFDTFTLSFDDGTAIRVTKEIKTTQHRRRRGHHHTLKVAIIKDQVVVKDFTPKESRRPVRGPYSLIEYIDHWLPLSRTGPRTWLDPSTREVLELDEVIERYGHTLPAEVYAEIQTPDDDPQEFRHIQESLKVRLIRTQRLDAAQGKEQAEPTVDHYAKDLAKRIQEVLGKYAARAQELDRTFPDRLLKYPDQLSKEELIGRLEKLEAKRDRLSALGFVNKEESLRMPSGQAIEQRRDVLSVYVEDTEEKLSVFDELAERIDLFSRILNDRLLYKQLVVSREKGFGFRSIVGAEVLPSHLSSGEQHELVLLYELLFMVDRSWLVLIDEPEISLHVAWQSEFLRDIRDVVTLSDVDVVLATHSPVIIGEHWDLTVQLGGTASPKDTNELDEAVSSTG